VLIGWCPSGPSGPGGPDLSERDRAPFTLLRPHLHLVAAAHTNIQIAHRLGVSEGIVRTHLRNVYERLQVPSRIAAITRTFPDLTAV
jgi:ATP/maltotriose-dependent transcriptional regulator MalT